MSAADFTKLAELFPDETVTHSYVQDIELPAKPGEASPGTFALITLDNGLDHTKPTTLGPNTLVELGTVLEGLKERAARGEIVGVGVTGKPYFLVAGADLSSVKSLEDREHGLWMAQLGHDVYATLANLGVPSFAFINGVALGGGLEIALQSTYRTVSTAAGALALPEAFIGLVPGWGGVYILPRLIGPENAVKVMIENPLSNNRTLTGPQAFTLGIADALFEPADFLEQSLGWASAVISGSIVPDRPNAVDPSSPDVADRWSAAVVRGTGSGGGQDVQRIAGTGQSPGHPRSQPHHDPGRVRCPRVRDPRRPDADRRVPGHGVRLPGPGPEAFQAPGRRTGPEARPSRHQGGGCRCGTDGKPACPALCPPAEGSRGHDGHRPGQGGQGRGVRPCRSGQAARQETDQPGRSQPNQGAGHRIGLQGGLRGRRLRHRSRLRGTERQEAGLCRGGADRLGRVHPRHEHVLAVRHGHGRRP